MNLVSINNKLGEIQVPQIMVDALGWEEIQQRVERSFKGMVAFCPTIELAWGHAVNNTWAAFHGTQDLLRRMK